MLVVHYRTLICLALTINLGAACTAKVGGWRQNASAAATPTQDTSSGLWSDDYVPLVDQGSCNSELTAFAAQVWLPVASVDCLACHVTHGMAPQRGSRLSLAAPNEPKYLEKNLAAMRSMASQMVDGEPLLFAKATGTMQHGGGQRFAPGSSADLALRKFFATTNFDTSCDQAVTSEKLQSVVMLSPSETLRKAALQVAGRLPTDKEKSLANQGMMDAALTSVLASPSFGNYVMRVIDDTYRSVAANKNNLGIDYYSYNENIAPSYCASAPLSNGRPVTSGCQLFWHGNNAPSGVEGVDDEDTTLRALSGAGLRLVAYLATTGHDYRDILNADYMLLNPWSARSLSNDFSYNLLRQTTWKNINDPNEFRPIRPNKPKWPNVGLLTDVAYLTNFSTTVTNRNRLRANFIYKYFLGMDVLALSQRPTNLNVLLVEAAKDPNALPPFMTNGLCTSCHSLIDPMAGNFAGYNDGLSFHAPEDYPDGFYGPYKMFPAGFEGVPEPNEMRSQGPRWLAQQITADPRFARSMVTWWYTILTSQQPLGDASATTKDLNGYLAAQRYQDQVFDQITADFVASNYNIQVVIKELIQSVYYRSRELSPKVAQDDYTMLDTLVPYRWVGPDALNDKYLATTGTTLLSHDAQWSGWGWLNQPLIRDYLGLLGGVDALRNMTLPNFSATGLMVRITTTTASQIACKLVPDEFAARVEQRRLFGMVEPDLIPDTPAHQQAIRDAIADMYVRVAGSDAQARYDEIDDAYTLFVSAFQSAQKAADTSLADQCQNDTVKDDTKFTVKAWIAVVTYILSDPSLVQE